MTDRERERDALARSLADVSNEQFHAALAVFDAEAEREDAARAFAEDPSSEDAYWRVHTATQHAAAARLRQRGVRA